MAHSTTAHTDSAPSRSRMRRSGKLKPVRTFSSHHQSLNARSFLARPRVGCQDFFEGWMLSDFVAIHRACDGVGDLGEVDTSGAEGLDGDLVGSIEDRRERAAHFSRFAREVQRRKAVVIRLFKVQRAEFGKIGLNTFACGAIRIRESVLDGQTHIRRRELRDDRSIDELDHGMNDALRMNHNADAIHAYAEKPARFDHLQAFVEQGRRIDGDLAPHYPRWMLKGALHSDLRKFLFRSCAEGTARSSEPKPAHRRSGFSV